MVPEQIGASTGEECSDEFFIYKCKVLPCHKGCPPESWSACPFRHEGELGCRRDPLQYQYKDVVCTEYRKHGWCRRGDACPCTHNVFEFWLHPTRYRTQMCNQGPACMRHICFFAHDEGQLRTPIAPASVQMAPAEPSSDQEPLLDPPALPVPAASPQSRPTSDRFVADEKASSLSRRWSRGSGHTNATSPTSAGSRLASRLGSLGSDTTMRAASPTGSTPGQSIELAGRRGSSVNSDAGSGQASGLFRPASSNCADASLEQEQVVDSQWKRTFPFAPPSACASGGHPEFPGLDVPASFGDRSLEEQNGVISMLSTLLSDAVKVRDARLQQSPAAPLAGRIGSHPPTITSHYAAARQLLLGKQHAEQQAQEAQRNLTVDRLLLEKQASTPSSGLQYSNLRPA
ncbi:hypothetical protein WJX72_006585 [[Myrmecia] bisecta]|uniref:C3H1-type domain-containing protein n=1 Tax=[Myrmecia] bisecta TaxID=41462 RepID=A0AAW1QR22_9CHLO